MHQRFLAEPGELALGVAACGLRNRFRGGSESDGAFEVRPQLAVPDEVERLGIMGNSTVNKLRYFFQPAMFEHRMNALLDAIVQRGARRLQPDLDRRVSFQARAASLVDFGQRPPSEQADLDRANHLGAIARANAQSSIGVKAPQNAMQVLEAVFVRAGFQPRPQFFGARGGVGQAFQQRTKIKPRPDGQDWKPRALAQVLEDCKSLATIFSRCK